MTTRATPFDPTRVAHLNGRFAPVSSCPGSTTGAWAARTGRSRWRPGAGAPT